jgi:hypothetical protein
MDRVILCVSIDGKCPQRYALLFPDCSELIDYFELSFPRFTIGSKCDVQSQRGNGRAVRLQVKHKRGLINAITMRSNKFLKLAGKYKKLVDICAFEHGITKVQPFAAIR